LVSLTAEGDYIESDKNQGEWFEDDFRNGWEDAGIFET
jgi:hypothetical protein